MNAGGRRHLARRSHAGVWYRAVPPAFYADPLGHYHTTEIAGLFNAAGPTRPGFPVLYLAEDPQVALLEVGVLLRLRPGSRVVPSPSAGPVTIVPVRVQLSAVFDLCDDTQLQLIDTSVQELTGDRLGYQFRRPTRGRPPLAPTQQLGAALFRTPRVEGFLSYSARSPDRRTLVVFPTKLRPGSLIEVTDPTTGRVLQRLP